MIDSRKEHDWVFQAGRLEERALIVLALRAYVSDDGFTDSNGDTVWVHAGDYHGVYRAIELIEGMD